MTLRIEDMEGSGDVLLMNSAYDEYKDEVEVDSMVLVEGTTSSKENSDQPGVFANSIEPLETARENRTKAVNITISTLGFEESDIEPIVKTCEKYPGKLPLRIKLKTVSSGVCPLKSKRYTVSSDPAFIKDLREVLGQKEVWIS